MEKTRIISVREQIVKEMFGPEDEVSRQFESLVNEEELRYLDSH